MRQPLRKLRFPLATLILTAAAATLLTGCNTVKGIGQDITYIGQASEELINGGP